jgi:hypothetical protein
MYIYTDIRLVQKYVHFAIIANFAIPKRIIKTIIVLC